jgi:CRISPR-associated endonuclease/helicase Cas3
VAAGFSADCENGDKMISQDILAHIAEDGRRHTLFEHLRDTAERAATFAEPFASAAWEWNAGILHDIGKADALFQAYIRRVNGIDDPEYDGIGKNRVNHSSAGATFAEELFNQPNMPIGRALAYIAAGHHAGLPDWFPADTGNAALQIRLQEGKENLNRIRHITEPLVACLRAITKPPPFVKSDNYHLWVRMLYSCLVDADFLNTETFMNPAQMNTRSGFKSMIGLKKSFDEYMHRKTGCASKTAVNIARKEILVSCRSAAEQAPGLFSLTVPTGGGKTLSSLAFALDHAIRYNKQRIIYAIPYTSIIEQTAEIFAEIFGAENIVEHHSNLDPINDTPRNALASENWDAPIIITTNVQLFESLFASKSSRCRKLHNIVNSILILDEAQLIRPELLSPCVSVMNTLTRCYGVTLLLSTATQPALPGLDTQREIISDPPALYSRLKRTEIIIPISLTDATDWQTLAGDILKHPQVLCVVNSRRDCYDLFSLMPEGTIHLSALMCGEHRSEVIADIKHRLSNGDSIRVISTQLIEAGVDIDFPIVYRALAGLDSIAQAAGRCNREGKLNADGQFGQVHVFVPPKPAPRGLLHKGESTTKELLSITDFDLQKPEAYKDYFKCFYSKVNDIGIRFHDWLTPDDPNVMAVHFRTAAQHFHFIDDQAQRPVIVRYGQGDKLLATLRKYGPNRPLMRKLQRYTVNLPTRLVQAMLHDGRLEENAFGIIAQSGLNIYDDKIGLDIYKESLPVEDLVI